MSDYVAFGFVTLSLRMFINANYIALKQYYTLDHTQNLFLQKIKTNIKVFFIKVHNRVEQECMEIFKMTKSEFLNFLFLFLII